MVMLSGQDPRNENHIEVYLTVPEMRRGVDKRICLPSGLSVTIRIPPGSQDGLTLRLRGKGRDGTEDFFVHVREDLDQSSRP